MYADVGFLAVCRLRQLLAWCCLLGLLSACSDQAEDATRPPLIPETTRVADAEARAALTSYDSASGVLRFARSTRLLSALRPGDVLVSEPSTAAPHGYLRKVLRVAEEGEAVIVETAVASLTDAVHRGTLDAAGELAESDLESANSDLRGVSFRPLDAIDVGDGYRFHAAFNEVVLDIDEGDVKAQVRVSGSVHFNAGYNIGIGIDNINLLEGRPIPEIDRFEAWIGFDQAARLRVSGEAHARLTKEKKVAEYRYKPKCFFIGPVPVCVVPTIFLFVGASGEVHLKFDYGVTQAAKAQIGAKWEAGVGWRDIEPTPWVSGSLDQQFDVFGAFNVKAYAKSEGALLLYGIAGPTIGAKFGLELDAAIPRNPFWIARAHLDTYYGFIVDIPVLGRVADGSGDIYSVRGEIGRSANAAPRLAGLRVASYGFFGNQYELSCTASDPEDGVPEITWTSNLAGELGKGTSLIVSLPFGQHTITARARDGAGATAELTEVVTVVNNPPRLSIDEPRAASVYYAGQTVFFDAYTFDPESGQELAPTGVTWRSNLDGVLATGARSSGVVRALGMHTISVTGTDRDGAAANAQTTVSVIPVPPQGAPPTARVLASYNPYTSDGVTRITWIAEAVDREDGALMGNALSWRFEPISTGIRSDLPEVAYGSPLTTVIRGVGKFRIVLTVRDTSGQSTTVQKEGEVLVLR